MISCQTSTNSVDRVRARVEIRDVASIKCQLLRDDTLLLIWIVDENGDKVSIELSRVAHSLLLKAFSDSYYAFSLNEAVALDRAAEALRAISERYKHAPKAGSTEHFQQREEQRGS